MPKTDTDQKNSYVYDRYNLDDTNDFAKYDLAGNKIWDKKVEGSDGTLFSPDGIVVNDYGELFCRVRYDGDYNGRTFKVPTDASTEAIWDKTTDGYAENICHIGKDIVVYAGSSLVRCNSDDGSTVWEADFSDPAGVFGNCKLLVLMQNAGYGEYSFFRIDIETGESMFQFPIETSSDELAIGEDGYFYIYDSSDVLHQLSPEDGSEVNSIDAYGDLGADYILLGAVDSASKVYMIVNYTDSDPKLEKMDMSTNRDWSVTYDISSSRMYFIK